MKTFRIVFDEALIDRLDRPPAMRERGRSAVLREATVGYPELRDTEEIARRYRAGYRDTSTLDSELEGWAAEHHRTTRSHDGPDEEHRE